MRVVLGLAAALMLAAAPALAHDDRPRVTPLPFPPPRPLAPGDLMLSLAEYDGTRAQVLGGFVIQFQDAETVCGPGLSDSRNLG